MRRSDIISHLVGQLDDHERATNRTIRNELSGERLTIQPQSRALILYPCSYPQRSDQEEPVSRSIQAASSV
jgi:hypothetical protein